MNESNFSPIILDVLSFITYYIDTKTLLQLNCCSKVIRSSICDDEHLWYQRLELDYGAWPGLLCTYTAIRHTNNEPVNNDVNSTNFIGEAR